MKTSYVFLAPGFEEVEALTPVDVLRRAGLPVATVAVTTDASLTVEGAHGVGITADVHINDLTPGLEAEWMVCPGGLPGGENLHNSQALRALLLGQRKAGGGIAAICASPALVLAPLGLLDGRDATCYPGFQSHFPDTVRYTQGPVVTYPDLVTANGPATSLPFALALVALSASEEKAVEVGAGMLFTPCLEMPH